MFCNQCEQTKEGRGCNAFGICGKEAPVADLQDALIHALQGVALYGLDGRERGVVDHEADLFTLEAIFATLTNVDFDPARFHALIHRAIEVREALRSEVHGSRTAWGHPAATFTPADSVAELQRQSAELNFIQGLDLDPDIRSLKQTLLYGVKGLAAYAHHAWMLGRRDDRIVAFIYEALVALTRTDLALQEAVGLVLKAGEINLLTMELLDRAHTETFGHPHPTSVSLGSRAGKAILVSGHDLYDLSLLLEQTKDTGIHVYTHGEMLPAHGYPGLHRYPHLAGHFGTAWQHQQEELPQFPGPVLFTTNCIQRPHPRYQDRVFTTGMVGWPRCRHIADKDFSALIDMALAMPGFGQDRPGTSVMVGFGHHTVLSLADQIVDAVKTKAIRHFFLVGGCDGAKPGRDYFTRFVEQTPQDCVVLTLACGKFRFFDQKLGEIGGIPRLLDVGQCNDAYSAIRIAQALADAFDCSVNELPLSLIVSWYEQKAVAVLLSLLHLGIKNIRLGPSLPAFMTPSVLDLLVKEFQIRPIAATPAEDLRAVLQPA